MAAAAGASAAAGPEARAAALRETLRLAGDLAEALVEQTARAKRQSMALPASPLPISELERLGTQAAKAQRQCAELIEGLGTIEAREGASAPARATTR